MHRSSGKKCWSKYILHSMHFWHNLLGILNLGWYEPHKYLDISVHIGAARRHTALVAFQTALFSLQNGLMSKMHIM